VVNPADKPRHDETDEALAGDRPDSRASTDAQASADESAGSTRESGEVAQLRAELEQMRDRLLRAQAEQENLRRRMQRELQDERKFAHQPLLLDLLPVLDNMQRAVEAAELNPDATGLLEGFKMLRQLLLTTLEKYNCRPVPALGVMFDPTLHQALSQVPSQEPRGKITQVNQAGYQLHDRVIRPAQVIVSSGPPQDKKH
jgi:molecular chaperone GrpE